MLARIDAARRGDDYAAMVAAVWRSFAEPDHSLGDEARRIRCPELLVWGALDPVLPAKVAGAAAARVIPGSRLSVLRTGHSPFVEAPDEFLTEVLPFLEGLKVDESVHRAGSSSKLERPPAMDRNLRANRA